MIEINLLPDVKQEFLRARRMRNTVISMSILIGLASAALVVALLLILGVQAGREALADNNIKDEYAKLSSVDDLSELVTLQAQLGSIGELHDNKTMTSRMFSMLQVINLGGSNNVQFSTVVLTPEDNTIRLEGSTPHGYNAVEALKKTITNTNLEFRQDGESITEPMAARVSIGDTTLGEDASGRRVVRFEVVIDSNEVLFSNQVRNMRILGPDRRIDVTDSRIGVPESLFAAPPTEDEDE